MRSSEISLYQEAKEGLITLLARLGKLSIAWIVMLLITGGNPSALILGLTVLGSGSFVAWSEYQRLSMRERKTPSLNLQEILDSILQSETDNFAQLAQQQGLNPQSDFVGSDLRGIDGRGCDFRNWNFSQAELSEAQLSDAHLEQVSLSEAKLFYADLSYANLQYANLSHADLFDANLTGADLTGVNLTGANLSHANLTETILANTQVVDAYFEENEGLSDEIKLDLKQRGAIFNDFLPDQVSH